MKKKHKGASLAIVLITSATLIILGGVLGLRVVSEVKQSVYKEKKTKAYYIARAGAAAASKWITNMNSSELDTLNSLGSQMISQPQDFGDGKFQIKINKQSEKIIIESTGMIEDGKYDNGTVKYVAEKVTAVLQKESTNTISKVETAVYGETGLYIKGKVSGDIGTSSSNAGAIEFDWGTSFNGTVYIPSGADKSKVIKVPKNFNINPVVKTFDVIPTYPKPVLPSFPENLSNKGSILLQGAQSKTIEGEGYYSNITIKSNNILTINTKSGDNIIRIGQLNVEQGHIKVTGSGRLLIYVDDFIKLKGSLNGGGDKNKVIFYCGEKGTLYITGETEINGSLYLGETNLSITGSGKVSGDIVTSGTSITITGSGLVEPKVIYAPNANIELSGSGTVKGAVIGKSVSMTGGSEIVLNGGIEIQIPIETVSQEGKATYKQIYWK
ncbi:hypothetical protein Q428_01350 [Fervidicella metallireducens AeB]|uniref:DUF7305 domain-containing protein n=1 Tax=Fervidicella metallireducens AeB TaxID=1403537 RepID=A0A017RYH8_9CLOT|nr:hypothetical protein [Fervidicella metallireducens]EYE89727.1 hypothetical protein Q428_01350 [Fervidicella metallireducens AeB]